MSTPRLTLAALGLLTLASWTARSAEMERVVLDANFPGAYQVEVADVDGDGKPDVIAVGGGTCAWYQNPTWKKRIVTSPAQTPGIISSASADLDGDGKAEIAIAYQFAMNEPAKGKLLLAVQGGSLDDPWTTQPIADVGSIHRLRWGDVDNDRRLDLVVAPIFGPSAKPPLFNEERAHIQVFRTGDDPVSGRWSSFPFGDAPVLHAIDVLRLAPEEPSIVLAASNFGVTRHDFKAQGATPGHASRTLATGARGEAPKKGSSEVHLGRLADGGRFLATIEPWHGTEVAVYRSRTLHPLAFGPRAVVDSTLSEGHALWVADVDGDGDDEIFAGFRGKGTSVLMFDHDGKSWSRSVVDSEIAAQDLRGGDLNGDGKPDVVAVGGSTHNVVLYRAK